MKYVYPAEVFNKLQRTSKQNEKKEQQDQRKKNTHTDPPERETHAATLHTKCS